MYRIAESASCCSVYVLGMVINTNKAKKNPVEHIRWIFDDN